MKWQIISIGKPSLDYAKSGIAEYTKRLRRYTKLEMIQQKEAGQEKNSRFLLDASEGAFRIVLDERGKAPSTREFATDVETWQNNGMKKIALLIGGADGHNQQVRDAADLIWSLSGFTLQHELALVVLLEQIYRVHTVLKGEPYHRD
ncbi:MAG: 23S rRNA (pseudouridine(1915)-N(3))-methyltransferase RlmH [Verrucomicrobiales bacterium]|nr:23S rRNA (pseudouridine(1915)-N(3))-methyltransferase RlmH [Verrucomicrobiales bacterium]